MLELDELGDEKMIFTGAAMSSFEMTLAEVVLHFLHVLCFLHDQTGRNCYLRVKWS